MPVKCNKIPYIDRANALAAVREIQIQQRFHSKKYGRGAKKCNLKMRPYHCLYCLKWHLTTLPKKNKK